jgi:hypothetical protein
MIENFKIVNYRGLQDVSFGPLRRVNLVTGPNGVGKTTLSEALWLYHGRYNPILLWNLHVQRRQISDPNPLVGLGERPVELRGVEQGQHFGVKFEFEELMSALPVPSKEFDRAPGDLRSEDVRGFASSIPSQTGTADVSPLPVIGRLQVTYGPDPQPRMETHGVFLGPTGPGLAGAGHRPRRPSAVIVTRAAPFPISPDTIERFSNVVAQGEKTHLLEILKVVQPTIKDIHVLSRQNTTSLWADVGSKQLLPVEALGGGIVRLLAIFVNLFAARDGLIAIDEIENGIHHSALPQLWQQILEVSALLNVQCVVTTHSLECVQAAARTGENREALPDFALHQMHQQDHVRQIETYTDDKLLAALDLGFEVR